MLSGTVLSNQTDCSSVNSFHTAAVGIIHEDDLTLITKQFWKVEKVPNSLRGSDDESCEK